MHVGLILAAAGYGSLRVSESGSPVSKMLEDVGGLPMFLRPIVAAVSAGVHDIVIVVNPLNERPIRDATQRWSRDHHVAIEFVVQPDRYGSGDAVFRAIGAARKLRLTKAIVAYGDMPLWSWRSFNELLWHGVNMRDALAMVTVERRDEHPSLHRYGRVLKNGNRIARVVEVDDRRIVADELNCTTVNPSLWVWDLNWLEKHIPIVMPVNRAGGKPEVHLPPLVSLAHECAMHIEEVALPLDRAYEALGVNTLEELELVRAHVRQ